MKSKSRQSYQIKDIAEFNSENIGKDFPFSEIEYIDTSSVTEGRLTGIQKISLEKSPSRAKRLVKNNDIIISTVRPNLKHYYFIKNSKENLVVSTGFVVIRPTKVVPLYLYYFLITPRFIEYLSGVADSHTSAYPSFPPEIIENTEINLPDDNTQRKIGKILSDLDTKIENLKNQNKILEQIVQTIFKSWFVDFDGVTEFDDSELGKIPKGWKIEYLENVCEKITDGSHFSPKAHHKATKPIGTVKNMDEYDFDFKSCKKISEHDFHELVKNGCMPEKGDVLFSKDGTIGLTMLYQNSKEIVILSSIAILRTKQNFSNYFLKIFLSRKNNLSVLIGGHSSGSALPRIVLKDLKKFKILFPPEKKLKKFDVIISPIFYEMFSNNNRIKNITSTRDTLLPKLMSGEIRV